jgi:hypothetical protein
MFGKTPPDTAQLRIEPPTRDSSFRASPERLPQFWKQMDEGSVGIESATRQDAANVA